MTGFHGRMGSRRSIAAADEVLGLYFPVLDYGFVALDDYMGGDEAIEAAARESFAGFLEDRTVEQRRNLLRHLMRERHTGPFEMTELRFHIGLPIFVMRQLVRHRTANLNEMSGRYSNLPMLFYQAPRERIRQQSKSNKQGSGDALVFEPSEYEAWCMERNAYYGGVRSRYERSLEQGVTRELARCDLPVSGYTVVSWKMDASNLMRFLQLRVDEHAQEEFRAYAKIIAGIFARVAPLTFEAWVDYVLGSVTFSRMELELLRSARPANPQKPATMTDREWREFFAKLEPSKLASFDLDLSQAKSGEHFHEMYKRATPSSDLVTG